MTLFHLAIAVDDLQAARRFYVEVLGAVPGRTSGHCMDIDFFGHQLSIHQVDTVPKTHLETEVDAVAVPLPHFGVILSWEEWELLAMGLERQGVSFFIPPTTRYAVEAAEQGSFFVLDPAGNALEFKAFRRPEAVFA